MGEGLLLIPEKLVKKIIKLEFIEMYELLPEFWLRDEEESKTLLGLPRRKKAPTTNIFQWLQCFSAMVGVLARAYPQIVPDLMAYQATIIRCYQDFEDLHWVQYDRMYRHQVSITKDLRWGKVDATLYSKCFAEKARRRAITLRIWPGYGQSHRVDLRNSLSSVLGGNLMFSLLGPSRVTVRVTSIGGSRCTYNPCKFLHVCSACRGKHPRAMCRAEGMRGGKGMPTKRPRSE